MDSTPARHNSFVSQRPAFPTAASSASSSTTSSASQSSSSLSTLSSSLASTTAFPSATPTSHPQHAMSPSNQQSTQYFGSLHPASVSQAQAQQQQQQQQFQQFQRPSNYEYKPNREGAGNTASETVSLLKDYNLVAEAAKRAQMAVLMRDLEGVEL